jgi:membrane associated rhomboid family serine protease
VPSGAQEQLQFTGWFVLTVLVVYEVIKFMSPLKDIDHASHLGGMLVGVISAQMYKSNEEKSGEKREGKKHLRWYEILLGKQAAIDK